LSGARKFIMGSFPVAGLPRLFCKTPIDVLIFMSYPKPIALAT
jgi:hypothetical protein